MVKTTARKGKLSNKSAAAATAPAAADSTPKIHKKIKKEKKPKPSKSISHNSDSDSDPNTEIQTLLEPFSKDQLIALLVDLSSSDDKLYSLVKSAADQDIGHRKFFVHGLDWETTRESLDSIFSAYGEIEDLNVVLDRATGKCKGYAFITYKSWKSAQNLLKTPRVQVGSRLASCQLASEGPPGQPGPAAPGIVSQKQFSASDYPQRKIYVSNVPLNANADRLRVFFEKFGEIESGPRGFDPMTGRFKGYAIFVFKTLEGAKKVLEEPVKLFDGSQLHCRKAAEGKSGVAGGAASITTALQPVQPQMLAAVAAAQQAQNVSLLGQQAGLVNSLYNSGLLTNGNLGALMGYYGMMGGAMPGAMPGAMAGAMPGMGLGTYGVPGGGDSGSSGAMLQGLQYAYPNVQAGQTSSSLGKTPGTGGSGYSQS